MIVIFFLDFEYCSYNYRSFDIANHFAEWVYDYTNTEYPYFKEDWTKYPTEKQRLRFIRSYLDEVGSRENPKKVIREVEVFALASHFFWSLWALINADTSQIPFGYWVSTDIVQINFLLLLTPPSSRSNASSFRSFVATYLTYSVLWQSLNMCIAFFFLLSVHSPIFCTHILLIFSLRFRLILVKCRDCQLQYNIWLSHKKIYENIWKLKGEK